MIESLETTVGAKACPGCGAAFTCGLEAGAGRCWCADLPALRPLPAGDAVAACYCPTCLQRMLDERSGTA